jgi:hypothetical protein
VQKQKGITFVYVSPICVHISVTIQDAKKGGKTGKGVGGDDKLRTALDAICREDLALRVVRDEGRSRPACVQSHAVC